MATIAKLDVLLSLDDQLSDKLGKTQDKLRGIGDSFRRTGTMLTAGLTMPIVGAGVAALNWAADLEESFNKTEVLFGDATDTVIGFSEGSAKAMGMSQQQALDFTSSFAGMLLPIAENEQELAGMSTTLTQLTSDFASFHNLNPEEAFVVLQSALAGETEAIRRFGVDVSAAAVEQKALEMGLADTSGELTEQDKALARYNLILEQTTEEQGDFARTSDSVSNKMKIMRARTKDIATSFGRLLLPVADSLLNAFDGLLNVLDGMSPSARRLALIIAGLAAALGPLLIAVGFLFPALATGLGIFAALLSPIGLLIAGIAALAFVFRDELVAALDTVIGWFSEFVELVRDVVTSSEDLYAKIYDLPAPLAALAFAVGVVVREFMDLVNAFRRDGLEGLLRELPASIEAIGNAFRNLGQVLLDAILSIDWSGVADDLRTLADRMAEIPLVGWVVAGVLDGIALAITAVVWALNIGKSIWDWFYGLLVDIGLIDPSPDGVIDDLTTSLGDGTAGAQNFNEELGKTKAMFTDLPEPIKAVGRAMLAAWTATMLLVTAVRVIVAPFRGLLTILRAIAGPIATVLSFATRLHPVLLILTAAVAGAILVWQAWEENWANFREVSLALWFVLNRMAEPLEAIWAISVLLAAVAWERISTGLDNIGAALLPLAIAAIVAVAWLEDLYDAAVLLVAISWQTISDGIDGVRNAVALAAIVFGIAQSQVQSLYNKFMLWVGLSWGVIKAGIDSVKEAIAFASFVFNLAVTNIQNLYDKFKLLVDLAWDSISSGINGVKSAIDGLKSTAEAVIGPLVDLYNAAQDLFSLPGFGGGDGDKSVFDSDDQLPATSPTTPGAAGGGGGKGDRFFGGSGGLGKISISVARQLDEIKATITTKVGEIETAANKLGTVFDASDTAISAFGASTTATITAWGSAVRMVVQSTYTALQSQTQSTMSQMRSIVTSTMTALRSTVQSAFTTMRAQTQAALMAMRSMLQSAFTAMRSTVTSTMTAMRSQITSSMNAARAAATSAANAMRASVVAAMQSMTTQSVGAVRSGMMQIPGIIASVGGAAAATARSIGAMISQGFAAGMLSALASIRSAANQMVQAANDALVAKAMIASPSRLFAEHGEMIGEGLALGIDHTNRRVATATANLVNVPGTVVPRGGGPVVQIITLEPGKWREFLADAQAGGEFARRFGGELAMLGGRV